MSIKKQIIECIKKNPDFAGTDIDSCAFRKNAVNMLEAGNYEELKKHASEMMKSALKTHGKVQMIMPSIDKLYDTEINEEYYSWEYQRIHYMHIPYVFLLGLFIYHNCVGVKHYILQEMERTTACIPKREYRYSNRNKYDEFLYRWRLGCLVHDIGYGVSLHNDDNTKQIRYLNKIFRPYSICFQNVLDLRFCQTDKGERDLIEELGRHGEICLAEYIECQLKNPQHGAIYDHGIVSALMMLQLFNAELLKPHNENNVIWDCEVIMPSIKSVALAVAYHNLDKNECMYEKSGHNKIYNIKNNALAWLLKVSDTLQEWDKPKVDGYDGKSPLPESTVSFKFGNNSIIISNLPNPADVKKTFENYIESDSIRIKTG
jgi:hypothetical protein